jgi:ankyrin repeat protein
MPSVVTFGARIQCPRFVAWPATQTSSRGVKMNTIKSNTREQRDKLNRELAKAVAHNDLPRIRYLCTIGADPNARVRPNGATIFMGAAYNGNKFTTHALLMHGRVNLYVTRTDGKSALTIAHERGHAEVANEIQTKLMFAERIKEMVLSSEKRALNMLRQRARVLANTVVNSAGDTALQLASRRYPRVTSSILKSLPTEFLQIANNDGRTIAREIEDHKPIFLRPGKNFRREPAH